MSNEEKILQMLELIQIQLKEHGEILSSLQKSSEFHKADTDKLTHQVSRIEGSVNTVKEDIKDIKKEFGILETVTKENLFDIAKLKAIK